MKAEFILYPVRYDGTDWRCVSIALHRCYFLVGEKTVHKE
jgi:hypothetical protein